MTEIEALKAEIERLAERQDKQALDVQAQLIAVGKRLDALEVRAWRKIANEIMRITVHTEI